MTNEMNYYKTIIQYDGTSYYGFQWQKDVPTVQNDLNQALRQLIVGKITTMGASRTDSGVHALSQAVKISSEQKIDCEMALIRLNTILPPQIRCLSFESCDGSFKPSVDSRSKEYYYFFTNRLQSLEADQLFLANNPHPLNIGLMEKCIQLFVGTHNFQNFYSAGSNVKSTVRNIFSCELSVVNPHSVLNGAALFKIPDNLVECYRFRIEGNGFLKQMIRHLISALWMVGRGRISPEEFSLLLTGPKREEQLWKPAPAKGLYLSRIEY